MCRPKWVCHIIGPSHTPRCRCVINPRYTQLGVKATTLGLNIHQSGNDNNTYSEIELLFISQLGNGMPVMLLGTPAKQRLLKEYFPSRVPLPFCKLSIGSNIPLLSKHSTAVFAKEKTSERIHYRFNTAISLHSAIRV